MEIWKDIKGFEGYYQVSNLGRIKSFSRNKNGVILKNCLDKQGYTRVNLCKDKKATQIRVHVIVSRNFIDQDYTKKGLHCNHIDGDKSNNKLSNLEVVSRSENELHAFRIGLKSHKGNKHNQRKINKKDAENIRIELNKGVSTIALAEKYNLSRSHIYHIKNFRTWN